MRGTSRHVAAFAITLIASACGTGDTKIDPGDLELRDLLGVAPEVATSWDADQRTSARHVLVDALDHHDDASVSLELVTAASVDDQLTRSLAMLDSRRFAAGDDALALVRIADGHATARRAPTVASLATGGGTVPHVEIQLSDRWGALTQTSHDVLAALAIDGGYKTGAVVVAPEPRLSVIAAFSDGAPSHMVVNPVLLAAIDPDAVALIAPAQRTGASDLDSPTLPVKPTPVGATAGNPYTFYGSVAECAYAQRLRCESCLPSSNCQPVTSSDGNTECQTLGANDGRGYYLLCINLSLAITSVDQCTADSVSGCARNTNAAADLSQLEANANFLADSTCSAGLDGCLAKIYGAPKNPFPGIVDGGVGTPPPDPPRNTDISCGDSCSNDNNNCDASPSCDCSGPSCNNSLSCDSTCANSNNQNGCGDNCDSCSSDSSSGGGSSGGGCGGDSSSSSGGGCGGCSGGGSSSSGGGGGGCGGGDCGGGGCSNSSGGGGCGGGGGGGCQVAKQEPSAAFAVALSLCWAFLPIPVAAAIRRRSRKRRRGSASASDSVDQPQSADPSAVESASALESDEASTSDDHAEEVQS